MRQIGMKGLYDEGAGQVADAGGAGIRGTMDQGVNTPWLNHLRATGDYFIGGQTNGSTLHALGSSYFSVGATKSIPDSNGDKGADIRGGMFMANDSLAERGESGQTRFQEIRSEVLRNSGFSAQSTDGNAATVIAAARYAQENNGGDGLVPTYLSTRDARQVESAMRNLQPEQAQALFGVDSHANDAMNVSSGDGTTNPVMGSTLIK